jgi:PAS domain S-box-containing protein
MDRVRRWIRSGRERLEPQPLSRRLLLFFTIVIGGISLFIYLFFPATIERQALEALRTKAQSIGSMVSFSIPSAVVFDDREALTEGLQGVLQFDDVQLVEVANTAGDVLVTLTAEQNNGNPRGGAAFPPGRGDGEVLELKAPVTFNDGEIGVVRVQLSLEDTHAQVSRARGLVALVSVAIFILGILAAIVIGAHLTQPLREVAEAAERIAAGDLSSRAPVSTKDEVGQLAESFNRMVTRLETAHDELELSSLQLQQILDNIPAEVAMFDLDGRYRYVNPAGIPDPSEREWVIGKTPVDYAERTGASEDLGRDAVKAIGRCIEEQHLVSTEQALKSDDGEEKYFVRLYSPVLDRCGSVTRVIGYGLDISDLREAEEALRETQERLLQAQKMESIGRLAGGIAHDFNNLLTTITGNADLLLMDMEKDDPARADIDEIHNAANRAAALTQQLLAFSRRQVSQPKVLDINEAIQGIKKMLHRLIGEDVELSTYLGEGLGSVRADPGQIEQVIVNLAVNARDAMPNGGALNIRTERVSYEEDRERGSAEAVPAGTYVLITVSDTGIGMDEKTQAHIFEPFFTKKRPGKGTGLGLAMVYGIIRQANGFIRVYSELGMGTTFKIYLPDVDEAAEPAGGAVVASVLAQGTETILLAEDQEGVRNMTKKILERCGYKVLAAEAPEVALRMARDYRGPIHLLLTDVVMPGMSGPELVERVIPVRPDTAILYMSGYTDDQLQHHGVLDSDITLIEKPFTASRLAGMVRTVLDRGAMSRTA